MTIDIERLKHSMLPMVEEYLEAPDAVLEDVIQTVVGDFQAMRRFSDEVKAALINELRTRYNTTATLPAILRGNDDYQPWLDERRDQIAWNQWSRYKYFLRTEKRWSEPVIKSLDETSDQILDLLADPQQVAPFDRQGLVMGYVQSGKTANFTALINKAFDAGFTVVIVLSGLHNNLRSQTQLRLDEEVLGATMKNRKAKQVGVGLLKGQPSGAAITPLTLFGDQGDFSEKKASFPYKPPILLVVKKNKSILTNLLHYLRYQSRFVTSAEVEGRAHPVIVGQPLLLIDDEADQATVNTSEIYDEDDNYLPEYDPTAINGLIRDIFHTFEKGAYVGYTATPFANILIDRESATEQYGNDLFPRDFIVGLPKPSNYCGPTEYFDLTMDDTEQQAAGLVRRVKQNDGFMPAGHKKTHLPQSLPADLVESIYAFLIATAIRRLRGQVNKHSSMLVHVTRYTDVQGRVFALIQDRVKRIHTEFKHGYGRTEHDTALKELYETDFVPTSKARQDGGETFNWASLRIEILSVLEKLQLKEIHGKSTDVLSYSEYKEGLYVLAVGGDKLSRGLTLDDLTVSYYLRPSKMYDTLMQMGRWFGYRDGYMDLCRIYTTPGLASHFYHIAVATEELRTQLDEMADLNMTPEEYVLQISAHPDLRLTSPNKMRAAQAVRVSYSASLVQTTVFENTKAFFAANFTATENFITRLGPPKQGVRCHLPADPVVAGTGDYYWQHVASDHVLTFLEKYQTLSDVSRVDTESLKEYILRRNADDELTSWTVVLMNNGDPSTRRIGGLKLCSGVTRKGLDEEYAADDESLSIRILTSEGNEFLDYTTKDREAARALTKPEKEPGAQKRAKSNRYAEARALRSEQKGLLLLYPLSTERGVLEKAKRSLALTEQEIPIGFAISFPRSQRAQGDRNKIVNRSVADR